MNYVNLQVWMNFYLVILETLCNPNLLQMGQTPVHDISTLILLFTRNTDADTLYSMDYTITLGPKYFSIG